MEDKEIELLTLTDEEGNEHELVIVDSLVANGTEYLALVPARESEEDGLYIYKVIKEGEEEYIEPIEDDKDIEKIKDMANNKNYRDTTDKKITGINKEFEEISETFEDRLSELYDSEED